MAGFPKDRLTELIKLHTRKPFPHDALKIQWSDESDMNGVLGGGIYARKMLINGGK